MFPEALNIRYMMRRTEIERIKIEFWSSVECNGFMSSVISHLLDLGFVNVRSCYQVSEQAYRGAQSWLTRAMLRFRMYIVYPMQLAFRMVVHRDRAVVIVTSNTFYAPLVACLFKARKHRVVHLLYDLFPDALVCAGRLKENGWGAKRIDSILSVVFRMSDVNVFLAPMLLEHVKKRFEVLNSPSIIPVGADDTQVGLPFSFKAKVNEPIVVMYCGNMGSMHDVDTLGDVLYAMRDLFFDEEGVLLKINICSSGRGYERLLTKFGNWPVNSIISFSGYLGSEQWIEAMRRTDIALVTMRNGAEKIVMPSKAYSAMQAGQAVIAIAPFESDLTHMILDNEIGWVVTPGDSKALERLLLSLPERRSEILRMQENAYTTACRYYSGTVVAGQWAELLRGVW